MSDPKPLCVAHVELCAHLYGGAQQVLYLLGELSKTEVRSVLIALSIQQWVRRRRQPALT